MRDGWTPAPDTGKEQVSHVSEVQVVLCRLVRPGRQAAAEKLSDRQTGAGVRGGPEAGSPPSFAEETVGGFLFGFAIPRKWCHLERARRALVVAAAGTKVSDLDARQVQEAIVRIQDAGYAQATRYGTYLGLRKLLVALGHAGARDYSGMVPKCAPPQPRPTTWSKEEAERVVETAPPYLRLFLLLCWRCALRKSTAAYLKPQDYDPGRREIAVRTKGASVVRLPVPEMVGKLVGLCLWPDISCVSQLRGRRTTANGIAKLAVQHFERQGVYGKTLHDLRRSMAHDVYAATHDLRVVQALLGHKHLYTTTNYVQKTGAEAHETLREIQEGRA